MTKNVICMTLETVFFYGVIHLCCKCFNPLHAHAYSLHPGSPEALLTRERV